MNEEQGLNEVLGIKTKGKAIIHRHAHDGIHAVNVKPIGRQEKSDGFKRPKLPERIDQLPESGHNDRFL